MNDITNVINISVSTSPAGIAGYNVNNVLCLTKDTPVVSLGTDSYRVYSNPTDVGTDWGTTSNVYYAAAAVFAQSPNILTGSGKFIVAPLVALETLDVAISRIAALVYFGAVSYTYAATQDEIEDAGTVCEAARKLLFVVSATASDLDSTGLLHDLYDLTLRYTRGLFYSVSEDKETFKWGYIGRLMSTAFSGTNTTQTMHLKQIAGVAADSGLTSTLLAKAEAIGVDVYAEYAGRASLMSYGANKFVDQQYNLEWFIGAIEVAGFNALAQTSTKIPQTESGMDYLKSVYRSVCEQAVANRYVAPGTWTSGDTFGNEEDFRRNITERGYYIYSIPVSQQLPADREARLSPIIQIAIKEAGAIHKSSIIVNINA